MGTITAGVDLAASEKTTAVAVLEWGDQVTVRSIDLPASDETIRGRVQDAQKIGIDCPFGWPSAFAHAAFRCAGLLPQLDGDSSDRSGEGRLVETYPAGSLRMWGLDHRGYKGRPRADKLASIAQSLNARLPLHFAGDTHELMRSVDHAFDAVVAALTARAQQLGLVEVIPEEYRELARVEGWIAVPRPDSLEDLVSGRPSGRRRAARGRR